MRFVGLDVHRDFCEVAIVEHGSVRSAGRVPTTPEALTLFAQSLGPDADVVLEGTGNALAIARLLRPHVARMVLTDSSVVHESGAAKTDKIDARALAMVLASGFLREVADRRGRGQGLCRPGRLGTSTGHRTVVGAGGLPPSLALVRAVF